MTQKIQKFLFSIFWAFNFWLVFKVYENFFTVDNSEKLFFLIGIVVLFMFFPIFGFGYRTVLNFFAFNLVSFASLIILIGFQMIDFALNRLDFPTGLLGWILICFMIPLFFFSYVITKKNS